MGYGDEIEFLLHMYAALQNRSLARQNALHIRPVLAYSSHPGHDMCALCIMPCSLYQRQYLLLVWTILKRFIVVYITWYDNLFPTIVMFYAFRCAVLTW
jgi:hypothetical protein